MYTPERVQLLYLTRQHYTICVFPVRRSFLCRNYTTKLGSMLANTLKYVVIESESCSRADLTYKVVVSTRTQCCAVRMPTLSRPISGVTAYIFATKTDNISQKLYSKSSCPLLLCIPDSVRHIRLFQLSAKFSLRMMSRCK